MAVSSVHVYTINSSLSLGIAGKGMKEQHKSA